MKVVLLITIIFLVLLMVYMFTIVWSNGCESKYRKFRIVSTYYNDKDAKRLRCKEKHVVYWKLFWLWHKYMTDAHDVEYAEFDTKEEAMQFIEDLTEPIRPHVEITNI